MTVNRTVGVGRYHSARVGAHEFRLGRDVARGCVGDVDTVRPVARLEGVDAEGQQPEMVVVNAVARWRPRATIAVAAKIGD